MVGITAQLPRKTTLQRRLSPEALRRGAILDWIAR